MIEVEVKAAGHPIGNIQITRCDNQDNSVDYDSWNAYAVALKLHNIDHSLHQCVVKHRYGDEWPALIRKALDALMSCGTLDEIVRRK